jgi:hypothetical protein
MKRITLIPATKAQLANGLLKNKANMKLYNVEEIPYSKRQSQTYPIAANCEETVANKMVIIVAMRTIGGSSHRRWPSQRATGEAPLLSISCVPLC